MELFALAFVSCSVSFGIVAVASILGWILAMTAVVVPLAAAASFFFNRKNRLSSFSDKCFGSPFVLLSLCAYTALVYIAYPHMRIEAQVFFVRLGQCLSWLFFAFVGLLAVTFAVFGLSGYRQERIAASSKSLTRYGVRFWAAVIVIVLLAFFIERADTTAVRWCLATMSVIWLPVVINSIVVAFRMLRAVSSRCCGGPLKHPQYALYEKEKDLLESESTLEQNAAKEKLTYRYSWSILSLEALELMVSLGPIADVCAGTGYVPWLLWQAGADIVAYDISPGINLHNKFHTFRLGWFWVKKLDAERAAAKHSDRAILFCWPPPGTNLMSFRALKAYQGDTVIFIGAASNLDGSGDDSGHVRFQKLLKKEWVLVTKIDLPSWADADYLRVFKRKR
jgi:hypothetical protein